ncbi:MAG: hypothetical protein EPO11_06370 [Gammaproteobacteria bacterium]|nr:MAG: hypothetical protein EPO11_06370 [Gammaproteobacteria bacterium]
MKKFGLIVLSLMLSSRIFAGEVTCPPDDQVKSVTLTEAFQSPYDPESWNFISTVFTHDGSTWNVSFGTFLPDAKTQEEALEQGQAYFNNAALQIKHPRPVAIPGKTLCDYVPDGEEYWISATTPPETTGARVKKIR